MSRPKILVVDDSRTIRTVVSRALTNAGYDAETASNGQEALAHVGRDCPQLIVLDIEMPLMDGYAFCQGLHEMGEPWSQLPVVFLTNVNSNAMELLGTRMGAYIHKPVRNDVLLENVARLLSATEASRSPDVVAAG